MGMKLGMSDIVLNSIHQLKRMVLLKIRKEIHKYKRFIAIGRRLASHFAYSNLENGRPSSSQQRSKPIVTVGFLRRFSKRVWVMTKPLDIEYGCWGMM
jgi:hypothetical protein